ncbi:P-type DNA transfer ATPase VirB11 [Kushneria indalinina]|uniref:Type IV secretion system protein n=1 Tax=Kushneria indalinina DSM 14324 TaxID=1122140 RepID=A0A3D9DRJ5_9GAMM|nr:P-type DNA transfer ATPase VirB11 [Kushneria indalinina]REC93330.1 type IV secretion system protein VirB11 [Kushneria indalinina DSM 14324]
MDKSTSSKNMLKSLGITQLLETDGLTEVAINKPGEIWTEVDGQWQRHEAPAITHDSFHQLVNALAVYNGGYVNASQPIASVTLPDGERGWIVMPPACAPFNCSLTIRKPSKKRFTLEDYRSTGRFSAAREVEPRNDDIEPYQKKLKAAIQERDIETVFRMAADYRLNVLMGGGTGSGKTTSMKTLADLYPHDKRYLTLEDSLELDLPNHPNHVRLLYSDVPGGVTSKKLIESCMRMKPDHIFLTELKGDETWSYLTLLNTGHNGSVTSSHFNNAASGHSRIADLVRQSPIGQTLDQDFILSTVRRTIDLVIFWDRTHLQEIYYNPEGQLRLARGEPYEG